MSSEPMVDQILAKYDEGHKNNKSVLCLEEENEIFMKYDQKSKQATKKFKPGDLRKSHMTEFGSAFFPLSSSKTLSMLQK